MTERAGGEGRGEVEEAVLAYLREHPGSGDTLDGIVEWWLPQQRYEIERSRIRQALAGLVASGVLHHERLPGGEWLYTLSEPPRASPSN